MENDTRKFYLRNSNTFEHIFHRNYRNDHVSTGVKRVNFTDAPLISQDLYFKRFAERSHHSYFSR